MLRTAPCPRFLHAFRRETSPRRELLPARPSYRLARPRRHVAFIKSTPNPKSRANLDDVKGVGGVFMMLLEGIVVGVGALMCAIGSWFAHKFYKGEKLPFELLAPPSAAEEAAMLSGGKANVPITPDVAYTGKG